MKKNYLTVLVIILFLSCKNTPPKTKITGNWKSEDGKISLKITSKEFTLDEGEEPIAESYFIKGDTIFTSYEGSQPYTKFVFRDVFDHTFTLIYPDSTAIKFKR